MSQALQRVFKQCISSIGFNELISHSLCEDNKINKFSADEKQINLIKLKQFLTQKWFLRLCTIVHYPSPINLIWSVSEFLFPDANLLLECLQRIVDLYLVK